jgi:hypothetical protein
MEELWRIVAMWAVLPMRHPSRAEDLQMACDLVGWGKVLVCLATLQRLGATTMRLRMHLQNMSCRMLAFNLREIREEVRIFYLQGIRHEFPFSQYLGRLRQFGEDSQVPSEAATAQESDTEQSLGSQ